MSQLKVLVVDDNHDLADGLAMVLEDEDHQVTIAYNGADAVDEFNKGSFDVVFLDVKLPDMSGVEVSQKMHRKDANTRVVMMTGYRVEQLLADVADNADVEVLRKPFEINRVLEILNQVKKESIVLIADDDQDFAEGLSDYLTEHGIKTMLAKDGRAAVDGVLSNPVEVLILDLRMPVMRGLEVYLELKQRGSAVKTIVVTGFAKEESDNIDVLRSMSVTGCMFKPFNPDDMLHAIEQIIAS
ncbi:MAG: response regulator [Gammaproteobacteria bacterium]|nr:response regulator [Gammaproteobacteria bacterium]MCW8924002.1 response regulator [Gammaproteobacteria bacterium]